MHNTDDACAYIPALAQYTWGHYMYYYYPPKALWKWLMNSLQHFNYLRNNLWQVLKFTVIVSKEDREWNGMGHHN